MERELDTRKTNTLEPKLYTELQRFVTSNRYTMKI